MYKILLPTDGSLSAWRAARRAAQLARQFDGEVLVIYVIPPVLTLVEKSASTGNANLNGMLATLRSAMQTGHEALTQTANILTGAGIPYTARLEQGHPADRICQIAREEQCDAIVIGSDGVDRTLARALGEVSQQISVCARYSVVLVS